MEANAASDEGVHFQSYPFDFLEFLNHQRFEPMEAYNHEHTKAVAALPCPQPHYEYPQPPTAAPPALFDRVPATIGTPKLKAEGPSSPSSATSSGTVQVKKAEPGAPAPPPHPQQQQQPPYSTPAAVPTGGQYQ
ncbi:PREDICTED: zinc finger protein 865-like [Thamnophis sirtalis]|uniref:Zinc finger protein 865-like n=1 Tax=Thamnophis sirtalis TaxID=35019 RepID=A0A6I9X2C5_9SAUR|nr:PREDICTED: zinc finger protein 865-like [Thamnophis sirtalis]